MSTTPIEKHVCNPQSAKQMLEWIKTRGGLALWRSINLSNPDKTWTTPLNKVDGTPMPKQSWEMANEPYRVITDPGEVVVDIPKEIKRFHVGTRRAEFAIKVTNGGTRKIRAAVSKAAEQYGDAWYEFDYSTQEAVIFVPEKSLPLQDYLAQVQG